MKKSNRLKKNEQTFRRLTGITVEKFEELVLEIVPLYEEWNKKRLKNRKRKREIQKEKTRNRRRE